MMDSIGETSGHKPPSPQGASESSTKKIRLPPFSSSSKTTFKTTSEASSSSPTRFSPGQTIAERNWRRCLDRYDMETAHEDFFHYLCQSRNFSFGIHCYREILTLQGSDLVAERMIQRLYAAMQVYWHQNDVIPKPWVLRKKWLLFGLAIVAAILFMGLRYEEHRPLLSLGVASLLLVMGLNSKWVSKL